MSGDDFDDEADTLERSRDGARKRLEEQLSDHFQVKVRVTDPDHVAVRTGLRLMASFMRQSLRHSEPFPTAPTLERVRQAGGVKPVEIEVHKDQPKAHRFRREIDANRMLTVDEYHAADRLQRADEIVHGASRIGGYDGTSGGGGYRPGRLELTELQQMAGAFRSAMLIGWTEQEREIIDNFILERPYPGLDRCLTGVEFSLRYTNNKQEARAKSRMAVKLVCARLLYRVIAWDSDQKRIRKEGRGAA